MKRSRSGASVAHAMFVPIVIATSGCGLLMTTAPPANNESLPMFSCTESSVGPGLDAAVAGLMLLNAGLLASEDDEWWDESDRNRAIGINVGLGVVAAVSAASGFEKTNRCRKAKEAWMLRMSRGSSRSSDSVLLRLILPPEVSDPPEIGERLESQWLRIHH